MNLLNFCEKTISVEEDTKDFIDNNREFKEIMKKVDNVFFFDDDTEKINRCDVTLTALIKNDKKEKSKFCIDESILFEEFGDVGNLNEFKTKKEALDFLYSEIEFKSWLVEKELWFDGRYIRRISNNKRIIEIDGKITEID